MTTVDAINDRSPLPPPPWGGPTMTLEEALATRRSVREFRPDALDLTELARLLWATQGRTAEGHRTTPSAGAMFPLEVYAVVGAVEGLAPGLYHYVPATHELALRRAGDVRRDLFAATVGQTALAEAPVSLVIACLYDRTTQKYGTRGIAYALMEAGHAAQNLSLEATVLGLGTTPVGAFRDDLVRTALDLPGSEHPVYLMPVGRGA